MTVETTVQALVMGLIQGFTEFLPISSSGHLIVVPSILGWTDPFIDSLAFSVMLHLGTMVALLVYFRWDWLRLIPAGLAVLRDRSLADDPDRRLAWLLLVTTIPAVIAGVLLNDPIETAFREPWLVAVTLTLGGVILWGAERAGSRRLGIGEVTFPMALGIGAAQALALVPGISRSGISISAGLLAGLRREPAARFSFLMATPITAMAGAWETRKLLVGESGVSVEVVPLIVGMVAAMVAGLIAIAALLRFLRSNSTTVFVVYRFGLAVVVAAWLLGTGR
jgi:undecaprenyl-diphosphatase